MPHPHDTLRHIERLKTAEKRLRNILRASIVASDRMLEQKISDAGPGAQRVDPHILTLARNSLTKAGDIIEVRRNRIPWFHLPGTPAKILEPRLDTLSELQARTQRGDFTVRLGQVLEIAVFKALQGQDSLMFFGGYPDLAAHDDSALYSKVEPPTFISGRSSGDRTLDFIVQLSGSTVAGLEVKNIRQWIYPNRDEIKSLLYKCCALDIVPVLIARRIHYSTFSVLNPCGVIIHQTFNQLYPASDAELAADVRNKKLLGYHDVRTGNDPDKRLLKFLHVNLPKLMPEARTKFDKFKDLLNDYATGEHDYKSFAARVKRRLRGEPEDLEPNEGEQPEADDEPWH